MIETSLRSFFASDREDVVAAYLFGGDRDPGARIRFEARARNEYFDLLPFLERYRRMDRRSA